MPPLPAQYFTSRLKDLPSDTLSNQTTNATVTRNVLESKFNNVMTLCAMVPLLIFTCLNSFIHQRSAKVTCCINLSRVTNGPLVSHMASRSCFCTVSTTTRHVGSLAPS